MSHFTTIGTYLTLISKCAPSIQAYLSLSYTFGGDSAFTVVVKCKSETPEDIYPALPRVAVKHREYKEN